MNLDKSYVIFASAADEKPASVADEEPAFVNKSSELDKSVVECSYQIKENKTELMVDQTMEDDTNVANDPIPENKSSSDVVVVSTSASTSSLRILEPLKHRPVTERKRVAFLSVKKPSPSKPKTMEIQPNVADEKKDKNEDPFFNLLTSGSLRDSLL